MSEEIHPLPGMVAVEPILHTRDFADTVQKRSGLFIPPPDNKNSFEGVPSQCRIYALPDDYKGDLKVGGRYVMKEKQPKGQKIAGKKLFFIELDKIIAVIAESAA